MTQDTETAEDARRQQVSPRRGSARRVVAIMLTLVVTVAATTYGVAALTESDGEQQAGSGPAPGDPAGAPASPYVTATPLNALHVTAAELELWRARAEAGPYAAPQDVSRNSPGDWVRIAENASAFLENPERSRWQGPVDNNPGGCVQKGLQGNDLGYWPPVQPADRLRDAAFVALIDDSATHARAVKSALLAQTGVAGVDFADRDRWCTGVILDGNPGFFVATWLTKLLFAASYLEAHDPAAFTRDERRRLDAWFRSAAEWMRVDTDLKLDELFVDRPGGDYTLTDIASSPSRGDRILYYDGPTAMTLHRRFNNRGARQARFVTLAGLVLDEPEFVEHGKRYVEDALRYSYFPSGAVGEFERWENDDPDLGWKYGCEFAGALITIAEHVARAGDMSLYEFSTTDGALGTEGAHHTGEPKSLHTLVRDLLGYVDGTYERYGTDDAEHAGDPEYRIDSVNLLEGTARIHDLQVLLANRYYQDPYIASVYTRLAAGAPPYPQQPRTGSGETAGGEGGVYPGALFMFGDVPAGDRADTAPTFPTPRRDGGG